MMGEIGSSCTAKESHLVTMRAAGNGRSKNQGHVAGFISSP